MLNLFSFISFYKKFQSRNSFREKRGNRPDFRRVIKIADKETQTELYEVENVEHTTLKRQYEELQNKYNGLKLAVTGNKLLIKNN